MAEPRVIRSVERGSQLLHKYLADRLAAMEISDAEAHALMHLGRPESATVADLQRMFRLPPSTLTGVLDRLEARGLTRRAINPEDRRSFVISLTPRGRKAASEVIELMSGTESSIRTRVRKADLDGFFAVMASLEQALQ